MEYECDYCNENLEDDEVCYCVECRLHYCTDCGDFYLYEEDGEEYNNFICYPCYRHVLRSRVQSVMRVRTRDNKDSILIGTVVGWINYNYSVNHVMGTSIYDLVKAYRICHSNPPENPSAVVGQVIIE